MGRESIAIDHGSSSDSHDAWNHMIKSIIRVVKRLSPRDIAERELEESKRLYLHYKSAEVHAQHCAKLYANQIERLETFLKTESYE